LWARLREMLPAASSYLAWIVSFALLICDWMTLRNLIRSITVKILVTMPTEERVARRIFPHLLVPAVDQIAVLALGVVALGLVFAVEHAYRTAAAQGMLKRRFIRTVALQVGVLVACFIFALILTII